MGVRGIAEISISGTSAAIANAVYSATGKRLRNFPITPEKLLLPEGVGAGLTNYRVYSRIERKTRKLEEVNEAFGEVESGKAKARLVFDIR